MIAWNRLHIRNQLQINMRITGKIKVSYTKVDQNFPMYNFIRLNLFSGNCFEIEAISVPDGFTLSKSIFLNSSKMLNMILLKDNLTKNV